MDEPDCGWTEYFQAIFQRVDEGKIKVFQDKYRKSEEERKDVLRWYGVCEGNLGKMLECVMLSNAGDFKRWVEEYINPAVERGEVERFDITGGEGGGEETGVENVELKVSIGRRKDGAEATAKALHRLPTFITNNRRSVIAEG